MSLYKLCECKNRYILHNIYIVICIYYYMITKMGNQIVEENGVKRLNKNLYPFATGNKTYKKNNGSREFIENVFS